MAKQSHNLEIRVGSIKPAGGFSQSVFTPASTAPAPRNAANHNPKPQPHGPAQLANQGIPTGTGANIKPVEGKPRQAGPSSGYAGGERPKNPPRRTRRPS